MNRTIDTHLAQDFRRDDIRATRRPQPEANEPKPAAQVRTDGGQPRIAVLHRLVARLA